MEQRNLLRLETAGTKQTYEKLQEKVVCFILSMGTMIRIDSVMCPQSSSRGRSTSASVTVTLTVM